MVKVIQLVKWWHSSPGCQAPDRSFLNSHTTFILRVLKFGLPWVPNGIGSTPGLGTRIPQHCTVWPKKKKKGEKRHFEFITRMFQRVCFIGPYPIKFLQSQWMIIGLETLSVSCKPLPYPIFLKSSMSSQFLLLFLHCLDLKIQFKWWIDGKWSKII